MKVFACKHDGHYLYGYSVIVAESKEECEEMLRNGLIEHHLNPDKAIEYFEIDTSKPNSTLLWNGDY